MQRRPVKWLLYKVVAQEQAQRRGRQYIVNDGCTFWHNNMHLMITPLDFLGATKFDFASFLSTTMSQPTTLTSHASISKMSNIG